MLSQIKTPSFLRDSAIFGTMVQFPVNPYVTGSSPVARAKIDTPLFQAFEQRAFLLPVVSPATPTHKSKQKFVRTNAGFILYFQPTVDSFRTFMAAPVLYKNL